MTYATQADMSARFKERELIELTDEANLGVIDTVALGVALKDADSEINGYLLAAAYALPLQQSSDELVRIACDIARYKLYDTRATEQVKARYDDAIKKLRDVSSGKASLGIDRASQPVAPVGGVQINAPDRVFDADSLAGY